MTTSALSTAATNDRAKLLSNALGRYHIRIFFSTVGVAEKYEIPHTRTHFNLRARHADRAVSCYTRRWPRAVWMRLFFRVKQTKNKLIWFVTTLWRGKSFPHSPKRGRRFYAADRPSSKTPATPLP